MPLQILSQNEQGGVGYHLRMKRRERMLGCNIFVTFYHKVHEEGFMVMLGLEQGGSRF